MSNRRAVILRVGATEPELVASFDTSLASLQRFVGGYVEYVRPHPLAFCKLLVDKLEPLEPAEGLHWRLVVNEEGKLRGLRHNELATYVYAYDRASPAWTGAGGGYVVGDAVLIEVD